MGFTEEKFNGLSKGNKYKKIAYAVSQFLETGKDEEYAARLIQWLKQREDDNLPIPDDRRGWQMLYEKLMQEMGRTPESFSEKLFDTDEEIKPRLPVSLILEDIRSPHNVGAIIRTGECFGVQRVIATGISPNPDINPKVQRTAMRVKVDTVYKSSINSVIDGLINDGAFIYALEKTGKSTSLHEADIQFPCVFILGNEEFGVSPDTLKRCNNIIHIALFGNKNSLNVSVAAGILLYELNKKFSAQ